MLKIWSIREAQAYVSETRRGGGSTGLIPTMGALHDGHLSLARQSLKDCDETIASIFVNPTQFGPGEDLSRYPRTLDADLESLEKEGVSGVFIPSPEQMYPPGFGTFVEPAEVAQPLEGQFRPGHFRGVATVVLKLFHALPVDRAYFGRKDYQQVKVIEAMTRDLNLPIEIITCPTVRDPDGLALSSRNRYLSPEERTRALLLNRALQTAKTMAAAGTTSVEDLEQVMRRVLTAESESVPGVDSIDYATVVDADTLTSLTRLDRDAVALIAVRIGATRLIDNEPIERIHESR